MTAYGEDLGIVGDSPEVGEWDTRQAVRLQTSADVWPEWSAELAPLSPGSAYKLVILRPTGEVVWEPLDGNRHWFLKVGEGACISTSFGDMVTDIELPVDVTLPKAACMGAGVRASFGDVASSRELPASPEKARDARRVHFKPSVSCCEVPNIRAVSAESKAALWWQPDDYAAFLQKRVEIAQAFVEARSSSVEFHEGDDSIRGLGLNRMRARKSTLSSYFRTVLTDQARQRCEARFQGKRFDEERLAQAGLRASAQQVQYAIDRASRDRTAVLEDASLEEPSNEPDNVVCPQVPTPDDFGPASALKKVPSYDLIQKRDSFEDLTKLSAQGFGQSLPRLLQDPRSDRRPCLSSGVGLVGGSLASSAEIE